MEPFPSFNKKVELGLVLSSELEEQGAGTNLIDFGDMCILNLFVEFVSYCGYVEARHYFLQCLYLKGRGTGFLV